MTERMLVAPIFILAVIATAVALFLSAAVFAPVAGALFIIAIVWPLQRNLQAILPQILALAVVFLAIVATMIDEMMPAPIWMPIRGNSQLPMRAPMMPMQMSATRPYPVPLTMCPASHPATRPTSKIMRIDSPDMPFPPIDPGALKQDCLSQEYPARGTARRADPQPATGGIP